MNLIDVTVADVVHDDLDVVVVDVVDMSELLIVSDDVNDVGVDRLGDSACWLLPVDVVNALLVVEVVVNDVKVVVFQVVDDDDGDAVVVGTVADDDNGNDDARCTGSLMHTKEKASKDDEKELVSMSLMM